MVGATTPSSVLARHKKLFIMAGAVLASVVVAAVATGPFLRHVARRMVIDAAQHICHGSVEVESVSVRVFPRIYVNGTNLVLHWPANGREASATTVVPKFAIDVGFAGMFRHPRHIDKITLDNIHITVPPRIHPAKRTAQKQENTYRVETVIANNAVLELLPSAPSEGSRDFRFFRVVLHSPRMDKPVRYEATVRVPAPRGDVTSSGQFGPTDFANAGNIPVSGAFNFNADLSTLHGLAGKLLSNGRFQGILSRVQVEGQTDSPDFTVKAGNHPVHLRTTFKGIVDGRNGDTFLDAVHGVFMRSSVDVSGAIHSTPGAKGKRIALDVRINNARLEDFLKFTVKAPRSPVVAATDLIVKFDLPPGPGSAWKRLRLDGNLGFDDASMTRPSAEAKLNELSNRARGNPEDGGDGHVVADLRGPFTMRDGVVTFPQVTFTTPGASAVGSGTYIPQTEAINFKGNLRLSVKVSETTTGVKSFFMKVLNPFFEKKQAPAVVPVTLTGTLAHPDFKAHLTK